MAKFSLSSRRTKFDKDRQDETNKKERQTDGLSLSERQTDGLSLVVRIAWWRETLDRPVVIHIGDLFQVIVDVAFHRALVELYRTRRFQHPKQAQLLLGMFLPKVSAQGIVISLRKRQVLAMILVDVPECTDNNLLPCLTL